MLKIYNRPDIKNYGKIKSKILNKIKDKPQTLYKLSIYLNQNSNEKNYIYKNIRDIIIDDLRNEMKIIVKKIRTTTYIYLYSHYKLYLK